MLAFAFTLISSLEDCVFSNLGIVVTQEDPSDAKAQPKRNVFPFHFVCPQNTHTNLFFELATYRSAMSMSKWMSNFTLKAVLCSWNHIVPATELQVEWKLAYV